MQTGFYTWLDRDRAKLPSNYLPEAPRVAIAGDSLLRTVGYRPGSKRPSGWRKCIPGVFRHRTGSDGMILQLRDGDAKLWVIERFHDGDWFNHPDGRRGLNIYALVCAGRPICAPTYQAAMHLAHHCHPASQSPVAAHWAQVFEQEVFDFEVRCARGRVAGLTG